MTQHKKPTLVCAPWKLRAVGFQISRWSVPSMEMDHQRVLKIWMDPEPCVVLGRLRETPLFFRVCILPPATDTASYIHYRHIAQNLMNLETKYTNNQTLQFTIPKARSRNKARYKIYSEFFTLLSNYMTICDRLCPLVNLFIPKIKFCTIYKILIVYSLAPVPCVLLCAFRMQSVITYL